MPLDWYFIGIQKESKKHSTSLLKKCGHQFFTNISALSSTFIMYIPWDSAEKSISKLLSVAFPCQIGLPSRLNICIFLPISRLDETVIMSVAGLGLCLAFYHRPDIIEVTVIILDFCIYISSPGNASIIDRKALFTFSSLLNTLKISGSILTRFSCYLKTLENLLGTDFEKSYLFRIPLFFIFLCSFLLSQ